MKRREREDPCSVCGHYHDYEGGEPCGICGHRLHSSDFGQELHPPSVLPTEVIPGFLFLGSYDHVSRSDLLKTLGIDHILNTVPNCPNLYKNSFDYHTVTADPPSLEECFNYIESVKAKNAKVIVHCMSGNTRSPAVVIYYLMRSNRWPLQHAHDIVKQKRPIMALKQQELQRLQQAEVELFGGQIPQPPAFHWQSSAGSGGHHNHRGVQQGQMQLCHQQQQQNGGFAVSFVPPEFSSAGFVFGAPHQQQQQQQPSSMTE